MSVVKAACRRHLRASRRGQGLLEFAIILPFLLFLILGAIEFGFVFQSEISLEYASREGARLGSALVNGGAPLGCGIGGSPNRLSVDPRIIQAVDRVLTSTGSPLNVSQVTEIRIFKATASGGEVPGLVNVWRPTPGAGPVLDGRPLDFSQATVGWNACTRTWIQAADSIGVQVGYRYRMQTPFLALAGWNTLTMHDRTIMAMNPAN